MCRWVDGIYLHSLHTYTQRGPHYTTAEVERHIERLWCHAFTALLQRKYLRWRGVFDLLKPDDSVTIYQSQREERKLYLKCCWHTLKYFGCILILSSGRSHLASACDLSKYEDAFHTHILVFRRITNAPNQQTHICARKHDRWKKGVPFYRHIQNPLCVDVHLFQPQMCFACVY